MIYHDFIQKYQKYLKIFQVCSPKIAALLLHSPCRPDMQRTSATLCPRVILADIKGAIASRFAVTTRERREGSKGRLQADSRFSF